MTTLRKRAKAKVRRKDYVRRRNINKHLPSETIEEKVPVYRPAVVKDGKCVDKKGRALVVKVGTRIKTKRVKKQRPKDRDGNAIPIIALPKSKKTRLSKKTLATQKKARGNAIQTASSR